MYGEHSGKRSHNLRGKNPTLCLLSYVPVFSPS
jgi:hypothetical protein